MAILDAGIFEIAVKATEDGEVDSGAYWEIRGAGDFLEYGYGAGRAVVPAGEYALKASLGAAELNETVVVDAGATLSKVAVLGVGLAVVDGFYTEAMRIEGGEHYVEIFGAKQALDGSRTSVGYAYGAGAQFDLPPGDYVALVRLGAAETEVPFTVRTGERTEVRGVLNAGVVAVTLPGQEGVELLSAGKDISGNRKSFGYSYGTWQTTAPAGDYVVRVDSNGTVVETPVTITAGERAEVTPVLP